MRRTDRATRVGWSGARVAAGHAAGLDQLLGLVYDLVNMVTVNVYEAKTQLSRLLARAEAGERIVIARAGKPIATLEPIRSRPRLRTPGRDRGRIIIHDDFDEPLPEFDPAFAHPGDPLAG